MAERRTPVILCAADYSDSAANTLEAAFRLAAQNGCSRLHVVHVRKNGHRIESAQGLAEELDGEEHALAEKVAEAHPTIEVVTQLRTGDPCYEVLSAVRELDADFLVLGTHGRTGLDHLTSLTERIMRLTPCNVVIVKPPAVATRLSRALDDRLAR